MNEKILRHYLFFVNLSPTNNLWNMNFFKALFGGRTESPEEKKEAEKAKNFDILKYDGVKALQINQFIQAIQCLEHALEIQEDLECRDYLSQALLHNGETLAAYEQLQKLHEAQPDNEDILLRMAQVAFMTENYGAMMSACEKSLLINKVNPAVYYLYGRACVGQEDATNAVAMFTKAISLNEDYADAYLMRARVQLVEGNVEAADEDSQWLMERAAEVEEVLMLKAQVETAKGQLKEALIHYDKVIEVNPFSLEGYRERAVIKENIGDHQGAEEDLAKVQELQEQRDEIETR